jgi:hypothetical protein
MSDEMNATPEAPEYGAPPPTAPRSVRDELTEPAQMSPITRLVNIFFSPGEVFQDIRRSPRDWWLPILVLVIVASAAGYVIQWRLDLTPAKLAAAQTDLAIDMQGKTRKDLTEQEKQAFEMQQNFTEVVFKFAPIAAFVFILIGFGILAGLYRVSLLIAQAQTTFFRVLSVVAYAGYVPGVVKSLLQMVLAFLRSPDDVDPKAYLINQGILATNLGAFVSLTEQPVLKTFLGYFDLFLIWQIVLLAIGLAAVSRKLKPGTAALIAVAPFVVMMLLQVLFAFATAK